MKVMDNKNIAKSTIIITILMICFKVLGFIKQIVIADVYGATIETDIYYIASGFVSGIIESIVKAFFVSIVAVYTNIRITEGKEKSSKLVNALLEILIPVFLVITSIVSITAPCLSIILAPSFSGTQKDILAVFIRILSPLVFFGVFELVFCAVLDSHKQFLLSHSKSFIYSLSVIFSCLFLSSHYGIYALVIAEFISCIFFTFVLFFGVKKLHEFSLVSLKENPELKSVLLTAVPLIIGNSALQINQIVDKSVASNLGTGVASALSYCHILDQFVTSVLIMNISNIIFANFAEFVAKGKTETLETTLSKALNIMICFLSGVSVITLACSKDIVTLVYYRGSFSNEAVNLTALALMGYALSFVTVAIRDLTIKSLYAFKDTKKPMIVTIVSVTINIVFSIIISRYLGIFGISFATSISAAIGMILSVIFLRNYMINYSFLDHFYEMMRCLPGIIVLSVICLIIHKTNVTNPLIVFVTSVVIGMPIYFLVLSFTKSRGMKELISLIRIGLRR